MNEEICILNRKLFNSKLLDNINFGLLYLLPLIVMTVRKLYIYISIIFIIYSCNLLYYICI